MLLKTFSEELWKTTVQDSDIEQCKHEVHKENKATETDTGSRDKTTDQRPDPKDSDSGQKKLTDSTIAGRKRKRRINLEGVDGEEEQHLPKKPRGKKKQSEGIGRLNTKLIVCTNVCVNCNTIDGADSDATPTSTSTNEQQLNLIRSGSMSSLDREKIEMTSFDTSSQKEQN